MSDIRLVRDVFQQLESAGWVARNGYACCMSCAKAELLPLNRDGVSCAWTTHNDTWDLLHGEIVNPFGMRVHVLGDVEVVADLLREKFGERVGFVEPDTDERIGEVLLLPAGVNAATYADRVFAGGTR